MAQMGRPPKPIEQKRRTGNPGKRALAPTSQLAAVPAIEPEPTEMAAEEVLGGVLQAGAAWLAASDTLAVVMLREAIEEYAILRDTVLATGSNSERRALRELTKQIIGQLSALGFDPAARTRLGVAEVKAQSALQRMQAEAAKRR